MLQDYLSPIWVENILSEHVIQEKLSLKANQWGNKLLINNAEMMPHLEDLDLAIIGVQEDRGEGGCKEAADAVRKQLYQLYNWQPTFRVGDLGNIKAGNSRKDTYSAVKEVVGVLMQEEVVPIIIGGTQDVTFGQFQGHGKHQEAVNVVIFDEKIDLFKDIPDGTTQQAFLYKMLTRQMGLSNFSHIGFQKYLNDESMVDTLEKLHFGCYGLGDIRSNMREVEPIIRNAHLVSIDMSCVRLSDAPAVNAASPHGFLGEETCQVTRYAGISDSVQSIGFYEFNPRLDRQEQTAQLIAQMIWYFVDGFYARKHDAPLNTEAKDYLKYMVNFKNNDHEIIFLKSKKSDRWWMKVPLLHKKKNGLDYELVPCSYSDYEIACKEEIPDRWMKAYLRFSR